LGGESAPPEAVIPDTNLISFARKFPGTLAEVLKCDAGILRIPQEGVHECYWNLEPDDPVAQRYQELLADARRVDTAAPSIVRRAEQLLRSTPGISRRRRPRTCSSPQPPSRSRASFSP
jgi:hypothetical protein